MSRDSHGAWSGLRLAYVARSRVPSDLANSLQVMKMCGLAAGEALDLLIPFRAGCARRGRPAVDVGELRIGGAIHIRRLRYPHWRIILKCAGSP
jgi:hypothetical protein